MKLLFAALILALVVTAGFSQTADPELTSGMVYGQGWACLVVAPEGWVFDSHSWSKYNIPAILYPKGTVIGDKKDLQAMIYFNSEKLLKTTDEEYFKYVAWDVGNIRQDPDRQVKKHLLDINDISTLVCYDLDYKKDKQFETAAYVRFKDIAFTTVLTATSSAQRQSLIPKFVQVIEKLKFIEVKPNRN